MEERHFKVEGKFGVLLDVFGFVPEMELKGVIHIFHGMGEHKKRYQHFMKWIAKKGYAVFAHDHRKHGLSVDDEFYKVGEFTVADKFDYLTNDAHNVVRHIKTEFSGLPYIILGHSMGSIILRRYLQKYATTTDLAIIMGTLPIVKSSKAMIPIALAKMIRFFKRNAFSPFMAELLNKPLLAKMDNPQTKFDWISSDEKQVEKYVNDPLCGYAYTPSFYIGFLQMCVDVNKSENMSEGKDIPLLFISGKDDPVGEFGKGVQELYEYYGAHGYFHLTLQLMEGYRHEVLNEKDRMTTYKFIDEWLSANL